MNTGSYLGHRTPDGIHILESILIQIITFKMISLSTALAMCMRWGLVIHHSKLMVQQFVHSAARIELVSQCGMQVAHHGIMDLVQMDIPAHSIHHQSQDILKEGLFSTTKEDIGIHIRQVQTQTQNLVEVDLYGCITTI